MWCTLITLIQYSPARICVSHLNTVNSTCSLLSAFLFSLLLLLYRQSDTPERLLLFNDHSQIESLLHTLTGRKKERKSIYFHFWHGRASLFSLFRLLLCLPRWPWSLCLVFQSSHSPSLLFSSTVLSCLFAFREDTWRMNQWHFENELRLFPVTPMGESWTLWKYFSLLSKYCLLSLSLAPSIE